MRNLSCEILIVGGGLAGATCATLLRKTGHDVLLIEAQDATTRRKLCGGLMTRRSIALAKALFGEEQVESLLGPELVDFRVITPGHDVNVPNLGMRALPRHTLDDLALSTYLDLGGRFADQCKLIDASFAGKCAYARYQGEELRISYDNLIAADGACSKVRRLQCGQPGQHFLVLEAEATPCQQPLTASYPEGLEGYCWYISSGRRANVGVGSHTGRPGLAKHLASFVEQLGIECESARGAMIPTGNDILLACDDTYYLGDAAGLVCPVTGEGIYYAMLSAERLAWAIDTGRDYAKLLAGECRAIAFQHASSKIISHPRSVELAFSAAEHSPLGTERTLKMVFNRTMGL